MIGAEHYYRDISKPEEIGGAEIDVDLDIDIKIEIGRQREQRRR